MRNLMKLAAETHVLHQWGDSGSPADDAHKDLSSNKGDQRKELGDLFDSTGAAQKDTEEIGKLLPVANKNNDTTASNPMLKVATHQAFFTGLRETGILKEASSDYLRAAYAAFEDEVTKLGMSLGKVFRGKRPGLISPATVPSSWGPGAVVKTGP